ncbi:MAG: hypothetical protein NVSMB38_08290 [Ktedonobacteraceae bacterium]
MANEKTSGPQKPDSGTPSMNGTSKQTQARIVPASAPTYTADQTSGKRRDKGKNSKPRVGGTAVPGAKSTQPKQITSTNDPNQQQAESYNRTMRRRMEQLGTGPTSEEDRGKSLQDRRKKQIERRKEKLEERRAELRKSMPGGGRLTLGSRNTYFIIAVVIIIILLIVIFILLRQFHVIG